MDRKDREREAASVLLANLHPKMISQVNLLVISALEGVLCDITLMLVAATLAPASTCAQA